MTHFVRKEAWSFWGRWTFASVLGWFVGLFAAIVLTYATVMLFYPEPTNLLVGLGVAFGVGYGQVIASRKAVPLTWLWAIGTVVGLGIPYAVLVIMEMFWGGLPEPFLPWVVSIALVGAAFGGLLQTLVLRRQTSRAYWWIPASIISCGVTWLAAYPLGEGAYAAGGLIYGALSGALLIWLVNLMPEEVD